MKFVTRSLFCVWNPFCYILVGFFLFCDRGNSIQYLAWSLEKYGFQRTFTDEITIIWVLSIFIQYFWNFCVGSLGSLDCRWSQKFPPEAQEVQSSCDCCDYNCSQESKKQIHRMIHTNNHGSGSWISIVIMMTLVQGIDWPSRSTFTCQNQGRSFSCFIFCEWFRIILNKPICSLWSKGTLVENNT